MEALYVLATLIPLLFGLWLGWSRQWDIIPKVGKMLIPLGVVALVAAVMGDLRPVGFAFAQVFLATAAIYTGWVLHKTYDTIRNG